MRSLRLILVPVVVALCFLSVPGMASAGEPSVEDALSKWHSGQRIRVILMSGEKLMGNLGEIHANSFVMLPDKRGLANRELRFDEVRSVEKKWTKTAKWIMGLGIYFGLVGIGVLT